MNFRVGQKVVCVDADLTCLDGTVELVRGRIYTVAWYGRYSHQWSGETKMSVRLVGVSRVNPAPLDDPKMPFRASRFRPVVERKTDIAVFTEILRKATKRKPVKATT